MLTHNYPNEADKVQLVSCSNYAYSMINNTLLNSFLFQQIFIVVLFTSKDFTAIVTPPGFHLQQTSQPRHKKQNNYVAEQPSFPTNRFVLAQNWSLSWSKLALWKPGFTQ